MSEATAAKGEAAGAIESGPAAGSAKGPRYRRILLKLSGEALLGSRQYGVDPDFCAFIAAQVAEVHSTGIEIGIVVGGGNIFRGLAAAAPLLPLRTSACSSPSNSHLLSLTCSSVSEFKSAT